MVFMVSVAIFIVLACIVVPGLTFAFVELSHRKANPADGVRTVGQSGEGASERELTEGAAGDPAEEAPTPSVVRFGRLLGWLRRRGLKRSLLPYKDVRV